MSNYRRIPVAGATFFFTVVTYQRRPILLKPDIRTALREAIRETRRLRFFAIDVWVLLPDHMHCLWTLPPDDGDFSARWSMIKAAVTRACGNTAPPNDTSRAARREGSIWQRRFWEHQIRDEADLIRHMDYSYWNPVKHGLVQRVIDWPYSTFHRDVRLGLYPMDWGGGNGMSENPAEFGE